MKSETNPALDPIQFAYRQGQSTEDTINGITHLTLQHLEIPKAYAQLLFIDFSSGFTLQLIKNDSWLFLNILLLHGFIFFNKPSIAF